MRPTVTIEPEATDEEVAAILAALDAAQPVVVAPTTDTHVAAGTWRFSGRWWSLPIPVRRHRPWH